MYYVAESRQSKALVGSGQAQRNGSTRQTYFIPFLPILQDRASVSPINKHATSLILDRNSMSQPGGRVSPRNERKRGSAERERECVCESLREKGKIREIGGVFNPKRVPCSSCLGIGSRERTEFGL